VAIEHPNQLDFSNAFLVLIIRTIEWGFQQFEVMGMKYFGENLSPK
jgi:hypothetical protein